MSDMQQLIELDAKARRYLDLKMSKIPSRAALKPNILIFYTADCEAIYVDGIPANLQLEYMFELYDSLRAWNFRVSPPSIQEFEVSRALWYYQIDDTHSFSHKHKSVRYNIVTMSLICGSQSHIEHCDKASRDFAWAFLMAWINSLIKHDDFSMQEEFLRRWHSTHMDLMTFKPSQLGLMKKRLTKLKSKVLPELPFHIDDFLIKGQELDIERIKKDGPAMALQWCLSQEFFSYNANMDIRAEEAANLDDVMEQLGIGEMDVDVDLSAVDWDWPPLQALIKEPEDITVLPRMPISEDSFWFSPSKAIDLMDTELEQAEEMLRAFTVSEGNAQTPIGNLTGS